MAYTETTTNSYGSRIGNSLKGLLVGFLLIIGSIGLLWWNEGRTIDTAKGLSEAESITVKGNIEQLDSSLEGKMVYNNGLADTDKVLLDEQFTINKKAIKLDRVVQMYQWKENIEEKREDNMGGSETVTKTYTYEKVWSSSHLNSLNYKEAGHINPTNWLYDSKKHVSDNVFLGILTLNTNFVSQLDKYTNYNISENDFLNFKKKSTINENINLESNSFYIGKTSLNSPEIGNLQISFKTVDPSIVSTIGVQNGSILVPYTTSRSTQVGLLEYGNITQGQMYVNAQNANSLLAWILRAVGLVLMFIGFKLIFDVFVIIAKFLPFLSSIIEFGASIIALLLTLIIGGTTIVIAWFFVRPILSISIIFIIGTIIFFVIKKKKESRNGIADSK